MMLFQGPTLVCGFAGSERNCKLALRKFEDCLDSNVVSRFSNKLTFCKSPEPLGL